ncbi:OsmC family protein [uncultured Agitococcus sp.]|uniref:OsmC family protein n=1 Tax=uncultured Agitococcus sp. TaxID=1506599 RepID=UPI002611D2A8|nr:OsmC family protein [uncultured Agitococcus sp.]
MKAAIQWVKDVSFVAESGSGHALVLDGAPEYGGRNIGPRPMELLLMGLGGCASFDIVTILKKARQQVTDVRAELSAERADAVPAVFTKIHLHFIVTGKELKEAQVKKAVELSAEKYCSASAMLSAGGVVITHDYEIVAE